MNSPNRFALNDEELGLIGLYPDILTALRASIPGNSIYDREAKPGEIELYLTGGDLYCKVLRPMRRKREWGLGR